MFTSLAAVNPMNPQRRLPLLRQCRQS